METRININYTPSKTSEVFGLFTLSFQGSDGKVHSVDTKFNPKQLWEFSRDTSSVAFDLLVLSMIVYNVDRAVLRLSNSDDGWKRNLILLNVPVINLEDMNKGREAFNKAINFLTGDNWDIHFIQADSYSYNPTKKVKEYNPQFFEKVALFSGGLDSLIGFIDEASTLSIDKKILLVSHMELGKEHSDQKSILKYCRENNIFSNKYEQVLLNAGLKPHSWNIKTPTESTFRSRSLLFFAAGIYIANKISPQCQLIVPENGTISINIPLDSGRRSSCSTRTTHPTFTESLCSIQAYEYDQLTLPVCKLAASASDSTLVCADAAYALEWCILDCRLCRSRMRHVHESQSLHNHRSAYALHRNRHLYAYVHLVNLSYRQALSPSHNASCNSLRRVCAL